ncbi:MAG: ATP-binding cassette domain-containing protein [Methanoregulaceae archaeon]|nr:ATP-binding cassette domain-containing protein [Methanoregulaceae archaeon]
MLAVETRELAKTFTTLKKEPGIAGSLKSLFSRARNEVRAVCGIDLNIQRGELVGFLGPNGAGKTTTLKMLTGILNPTSGFAEVLGYTPFDRKPEMLRRISLVMGNKNQLWWDLPAWDSFVVLRELYDVPADKFKQRIDRLLEVLAISDKVNTQVRKLSLGERMKCELVAALLHAPEVVFLDEPTLGLDVVSQQAIREFLKQLHEEEGTTILLTSHYMQDVQALCDRVIVINHGEKIFDDSLEALGKTFGDRRRIVLRFREPVESSALARYGEVSDAPDNGVAIDVPREDTPTVAAAVLQHFPVEDISIEDVDIEDIIRRLFTNAPA